MIQRPIVVGLTLCEQVVVEEKTRNLTLVNCFHRRVVTSLPSDPISFVVVASLIDGMGMIPIRITIGRLEDDEPLHEFDASFQVDNPLDELRIRHRVRELSFSQAGPYDVILFIGQEATAQRKLVVVVEEET